MAGITFDLKFNVSLKPVIQAGSVAEHAVAVQAAKDTEPFVPALTKSLVNRTQVTGGTIIYPGPYARYLYFGKVMVDERGNGPSRFVDKHGNEVIRFQKGAKLHATDRDLVFTKSVHSRATAHWFEVSKAQNMDKWLRVARRAVKRALG